MTCGSLGSSEGCGIRTMCEDLPDPRLSPAASFVVAWLPLVDRSPVPGTWSSLWSSNVIGINGHSMV